MAVNYTTNLSLGQPVTGTESGTWGDDVNNALTAYLDIAVAGTLSFSGDGAVTLANTQGTNLTTNIGSTTAQYAVLRFTGTLTLTKVVTAPSTSKIYLVDNATSGGFGVTVKASGQTGYTVAAGTRAFVYFNGTDYVLASTNDITKLTGTLGVANGGTGAATFTANNVLLGNGTSAFQVVAPGANGNILTSNGTTWVSSAAPATGVTSFSAGTTGFTPSTGTTGAVTLAGTLGVANGGTGLTSTPTNGQLDIGNGTGFTRAALTAGTGISITNGSGSITIATSGGSLNVGLARAIAINCILP